MLVTAAPILSPTTPFEIFPNRAGVRTANDSLRNEVKHLVQTINPVLKFQNEVMHGKIVRKNNAGEVCSGKIVAEKIKIPAGTTWVRPQGHSGSGDGRRERNGYSLIKSLFHGHKPRILRPSRRILHGNPSSMMLRMSAAQLAGLA